MMKNANKTKIGADIIHIVESDDEVQYVSYKQHGRKDDIGDHLIDAEQVPQQQHPLPFHSHTPSSVQQPRPIALHQRPMCGGAMTTPDDDPLTTNFNASSVGFQDKRRLSDVLRKETVGAWKKKRDYETVGNILYEPEDEVSRGDHISVGDQCNGGNGGEIASADDHCYGTCRGDHISVDDSIEEAMHVAQRDPAAQDDYARNDATHFVETNVGSGDNSLEAMPIQNYTGVDPKQRFGVVRIINIWYKGIRGQRVRVR
jgi:hypothetical protein